jgi:excisionase family DNA binding protein
VRRILIFGEFSEMSPLTTIKSASIQAEPQINQAVNRQCAETILTESEAAKYLKVSRPTLHRWRKNGSIRFYRAGFRVLYSVEKHLRPFLDECERVAERESAQISHNEAASLRND